MPLPCVQSTALAGSTDAQPAGCTSTWQLCCFSLAWCDTEAYHLTSVVRAGQGKFYELFEMDAHVGAEVLGLMYMRVRPRHVPSRVLGAAAAGDIDCLLQPWTESPCDLLNPFAIFMRLLVSLPGNPLHAESCVAETPCMQGHLGNGCV